MGGPSKVFIVNHNEEDLREWERMGYIALPGYGDVERNIEETRRIVEKLDSND